MQEIKILKSLTRHSKVHRFKLMYFITKKGHNAMEQLQRGTKLKKRSSGIIIIETSQASSWIL